MVERCVFTINDSFITQGLLGRCCGYGEHKIICYTNIPTIQKYEELFDGGFTRETLSRIGWNSNTTIETSEGTKTIQDTHTSAEQLITSVAEDMLAMRIEKQRLKEADVLRKKENKINRTEKLKRDEENTFITQHFPCEPNEASLRSKFQEVKEQHLREKLHTYNWQPKFREYFHESRLISGKYKSIIRSKTQVRTYEDIKKDRTYGLAKTSKTCARLYICYQGEQVGFAITYLINL